MDAVALVLAILALATFVAGARWRLSVRVGGHIALGLALLTVAWICQLVTLTGHYATFHH